MKRSLAQFFQFFFVESDTEAFNLVEKNQRPLAFYWFGNQKEPRQKWLKNIVAGGVTVNDCLLHCVQNDLPFGGVSYSGSGTYHGIWGFENFSHRKSIFKQSRFSAMKSVSPPYTKIKYKLLRMIRFLIWLLQLFLSKAWIFLLTFRFQLILGQS